MRTPAGISEAALRGRPARQARYASGWLLLACTVACAPAAGPSPYDALDAERASFQAPDLAIEVRNDHWRTMTVWVHWPGTRHFLGDAEPGTITTFRVTADLVRRFETLQLYARPSGSGDEVVTKPIEVRRGHRIEWRLSKVLTNSRMRVW